MNITITQEDYDELVDNQLWVDALEAAGVDNWGGYDIAREIYQELKNEEN